MEDGFEEYQSPPPKENPREKANLFSVICFLYTFNLYRTTRKKVFAENDLYQVLNVDRSKLLGDRLEKEWENELKKESPSLFKAMYRMFYKDYYVLCFIVLVLHLLRLSQPIALYYILLCFEPFEDQYKVEDAYIYITWIVISVFMFVLIVHSYAMALQHMGMKMRIACCALVYRKSLKLSLRSLANSTVGHVVNMVSNDVGRFDYVTMHLPYLCAFFFETPVMMYAIYAYLGYVPYMGCLTLYVLLPILILAGMWISKVRLRIALRTDERVRLMGEIIAGIKVIKMYVWEIPFTELLTKARRLEMKELFCMGYLKGTVLSLAIFMTKFAVLMAIVLYVYTGHVPTSEFVFITIGFINILKQNVTIFIPYIIAYVSETSISIKRLQKFLLQENYRKPEKYEERDSIGITLNGVSALWDVNHYENTLDGVSLNVEKDEIVGVVGAVGSGKSSLLCVILGELSVTEGNVRVRGRVAYSVQEPWLFNGNIRQNILFGEAYDDDKYNNVIAVCALRRDFTLFPHGDETIVGDRGITLSGGQKARISLARAIYRDADIYLLDDPLSAVDTQSARHIFNECIMGYLNGKCRILVTHQLQHLQSVPRIVMLRNGVVFFDGDFAGLIRVAGTFTKSLKSDVYDEEIIKKPADVWNNLKKEMFQSVQEHYFTGGIKAAVYGAYLRAGGRCLEIFLFVFLFLTTQSFDCSCDIFLMLWMNRERITPHTKDDIEYNTLIYTVLTMCLGVTSVVRTFYFYRFTLTASNKLHNNMFKSVIEAPMSFFDNNPSGRILNRFSKDIGIVDDTLPMVTFDTLQVLLFAFGVMVLLGLANVYMIPPIICLLVMFYYLKHQYLKTGRSIKRIEGIVRSPVFTHFNSSLVGITTIRAFGAEHVFVKEFERLQDIHSSAWHAFLSTSRAFGFCLDLICGILITCACYSILIFGAEFPPGNVGLIITQSVTLTGIFQWGVRQWSEMENQMTAVERVVEYIVLPKDHADDDYRTEEPPRHWPLEGRVEFRNLFMRYKERGPYVLKNLNFVVNPHEKIGIVGRTGAGKSSLISAIFQLSNTTGEILIDGVDISTVPLDKLRAQIAIIPQEPTLFKATLRKNLDPFDDYNDDEIWNALSKVRLLDTLELPHGLDTLVSEGGANYSIGQKQLLCLGRALLKQNKIMILDEATASVDPYTDSLIQDTIREEFKECTVLTIAHRLDTIIDADKVLLIDEGQNKEFDHPHLLLLQKGLFYGMVENTGRMMADNLEKLAKKSYELKTYGYTSPSYHGQNYTQNT